LPWPIIPERATPFSRSVPASATKGEEREGREEEKRKTSC